MNDPQPPTSGVEHEGFASFEECYERTVDALLAWAVMMCGDRELAEQAVTETYIAMYNEWERIRSPKGWAVTVMRRQLAEIAERDRRRRAREWRRLLEVPVPPDMPLDERAEIALVMRALHTLPRRQREVIVLYYPCDQTQERIAEILGISRDTVVDHLRAAIFNLQRKLGVAPPPARPGGRFAPRPAPVGTIAAMADQIGSRLLAVAAWLTEGNRTDDARESIRQRISADLSGLRKDRQQ